MNELDNYVSEEEESTKSQKAVASFYFNIKLIWKNITNRRRSISIIILGLVFSMSILFTASIWSNTSQKIIADDYLQTLDYEMYVSTFLPSVMQPIFTYVLDDSLVEDVHWYYPSVALFNFEDKADNYTWYPEDQQDDMNNPVSLTAAHIVSSAAMERIKLNLDVDGQASLNQGELMISYVQAKQLEVVYNKTISPGDEITVAITRYIPNTDIGEHRMEHYDIVNETIFENHTISGIYNYVGKNTVIARMLGGLGNTGGVLLDSIFFPMEDLRIEDLSIMDANSLLPKLLVKVSGQELRKEGISDMPDTMYALKERIEFRYWHAFAFVLSQEIQAMADEYTRSFGSTVVFVPTIAISIILTILSTQMTVKKRKEEIVFLRSKGAVSGQIIGMFFGEFVLISSISLILSIGIGILLSALIPAFGHNGFFSKELFLRYFQYLEISPYDIEIFTVLVLGIYLGITLFNVITFVRKDIHESQIMTKKGQRIIKIGVKVGSFVLILAGFIFLLIEYFRQVRGISNFGFSTVSISIQALLVFICLLFFICHFISQGINRLIKKLGRVYKAIFKKNSFLILKNLKRHTKNLTDLTFFLVLTVSLLAMLVTMRSSVIHNNDIESLYRMGADIRIDSLVPVNISEMEETLGQIEGIEEIVGFRTIRALWGTQIQIEVFGIDPDKFLKIGRWTDSSFINMTPEEGLMTLNETAKGVVLSSFLVNRLDFTVGEEIEVSGFTGSGQTQLLTITGVIQSAPGLGVAHGYDPKMNRDTDDWVLLNKDVLTDELNAHNGTLLLASMEEGADPVQIKQEIESLFPLLTVNPEEINPDYIGYFIDRYIPPVTIILLVGAIILNVVGVIYILISTDFILEQRRRENAVLLALGGNQTKVRGLLISEVSTFLLTTIVIGVPLGIAATAFSLLFVKPLLIAKEVITLSVYVDGVALFVIFASLCIAALIGMIPIIRKQMKYEIVQELRAIV